MTQSPVIAAMLGHWQSERASHLDSAGFATNPDADTLVRNNLFAFLMACSLDRTGNSDLIWNIPLQLKQDWGHLDPAMIQTMNRQELAQNPIIKRAPGQVSRVQLATTIISLASIVENDYGGAPERMLEGSISDIMESLQQIHGVGPNIARMTIILRILYFGLKPERGGRLLPKIDVHVERLFTRTGLVEVCSEQALGSVLKDYAVEDIAAIDQVCWELGQSYCRPTNPRCGECPINGACGHVGVSFPTAGGGARS